MSNKGFSLIEIVMFIIVFSIGVMGMLYLFFNITGKSSDPILRHKTIQNAQQVMEVIISKKFDEDTPNGGGTIPLTLVNIGAESGETDISDFDDIDDFVNSCGVQKEWSSSNFNISSNYSIFVEINYANVDSSGNVSKVDCSTPTNYKLIEVSVNNKSSKTSAKIEYIKGNF